MCDACRTGCLEILNDVPWVQNIVETLRYEVRSMWSTKFSVGILVEHSLMRRCWGPPCVFWNFKLVNTAGGISVPFHRTINTIKTCSGSISVSGKFLYIFAGKIKPEEYIRWYPLKLVFYCVFNGWCNMI